MSHTKVLNLAAGRDSQDRTAALETEQGQLLLLADGAGGLSGGREAAEFFIDYFRDTPLEPRGLTHSLAAFDRKLALRDMAGETTGIIILVQGDQLFGASVGDSEAWLVTAHDLVDLTQHQCRKPLLGSGDAFPMGFQAEAQSGVLMLASDGLTKYAPTNLIIDRLRGGNHPAMTTELADLARLPSGGLQDDLSVVLRVLCPGE